MDLRAESSPLAESLEAGRPGSFVGGGAELEALSAGVTETVDAVSAGCALAAGSDASDVVGARAEGALSVASTSEADEAGAAG